MGGSQGKKCRLEMGQIRDMENREPSGQGEFHSGGGQAASPPVVGKLGGKGLRAGHCGESVSAQ